MSANIKSTSFNTDHQNTNKSDQVKSDSIRDDKQEKRNPMESSKSRFNENAEQIGERIREKGAQIGQSVSRQVHGYPWAYVGGATVAGLALGYLMGRRSS